jgi:hypothetical protein
VRKITNNKKYLITSTGARHFVNICSSDDESDITDRNKKSSLKIWDINKFYLNNE